MPTTREKERAAAHGRAPSVTGSNDFLAAQQRAVRLTEILEKEHGTPDLGNLPDPLEELVWIALTRQTHRLNAVRSWAALRARYPTLQDVLEAPEGELREVLRPAGFSTQKARWIQASLVRVAEAFGSLTSEPLRAMADDEAERFLSNLPGVNLKSAKCVLLYSLGRQVLPVDTHLRRLAERVGLVERGLSEHRIHQSLEAIVPPTLRYALHVNAIPHGRMFCTALRPHCAACPVAALCDHARRSAGS